MNAAKQVAAMAPIVVWMWLAMMLVHELGHALAALATGGRLVSLELRPGYLSHTFVQPNPRPSTVAWSGFLVGWLVPQMTAPAWRIDGAIVGQALRAWAAFCLLAGGVYLATGGGERLTDTGKLTAEGWPLTGLVVVGLVVATVGYARSRTAWIGITQRLEREPIKARTATGWWIFLAAWIAAQRGLHTALAP